MWNILIVDDELDVHTITDIMYKQFSFDGQQVKTLHAKSAEEARKLLKENTDIAIAWIDVVMETDQSGLELVHYVRDTLGNKAIRLIIRTGQPGCAPEGEVIQQYDINDYREKTDLTKQKFYTTTIAALRAYKNLIEIQRARDEVVAQSESFQRFVPKEFLLMLDKPSIAEVKLGDFSEHSMQVMFVDIHGFTGLAEKIPAKEVFEYLNNWLTIIEPIITKNGGFIDKYLGDGVLALFANKTADKSLACAIEIHNKVQEYNKTQIATHEAPLSLGIGINTGDLILGVVGGEKRIDCTVISDVVNVASRIEALCGDYGANILITSNVYDALQKPENYQLRCAGRTLLRGRVEELVLYEVFDVDDSTLRQKKQSTLADLAQALTLQSQGQLKQAQQCLQTLLQQHPNDAILQHHLANITQALSVAD